MASQPKIKVLRLASVHYQHPNLESATKFLLDFGMIERQRDESRIYFSGYGQDQYIYVAEQSLTSRRAFIGATWEVESRKDLETAAAQPNATPIEEDHGPGGAKRVSIQDPNGFLVSFIHGQSRLMGSATMETNRIVGDEKPIVNLVDEKPRRGHFRSGPSPVHKLGHYGYMVPHDKYETTFNWYTSLINLVPTDAVFNPETGKDVTCFMHIDLGPIYTDHHSFFLGVSPNGKPAFVHHSSYEVNDTDTQALGHKWLYEKGYTNCWGIGRHVLGSQVFDYWFDTTGNIVEHYADGDLVNQDTAFTRSPEGPDSLYIWGPPLPLGFVTGKAEDAGKDAAAALGLLVS
ncbi:LOW QUALITY PROTEIN: Glyoxalase/Bleomycin resistance protein/Dihydroxybiphenyl dioxygenase [Microdochium trichocladiopsis]|uniref:Glyoxalase/Bleomycin resistance protein/Dihydroxybiphenyl dioxygenase n=1 Tax=Microdochium trichocladiopsis TaxID=1682393 RepID=A0A9P9BXI3_9PEZI|nr:LOW QUALITY PROTEIN: Glyoxalase/Bleomycin resistance protein/Dihydroxybiphenyl dioxygenase [Microdochium trichocladiopsis]KAH7037078.1 LOW QUALITY PROTEIN: Glyoxalase/Bleomycin resistance protein/Dihydroxybiphenyl dioxygenase [Microdochium trichocladiopsis]